MNNVSPCLIKKPADINASYNAALSENAANATTSSANRKKRGVVKHTKFWAPGRTLKIAFLGGNQDFKDAVKAAAQTWLPHINLKFNFVEGTEGDIRIMPADSFWSYIGTDALLEDETETMGLQSDILWPRFAASVIHEFGHVLGAEHEHQHPQANIPWNTAQTYRHYLMYGMTQEVVDQQILNKLDASEVNYSTYDPLSIMHYEILQVLTEGDFKIDFNSVISETDKTFMASIYPYPDTASA
jgi:hypothetical protein